MNFEETHMYYGFKGAFGFADVESRYQLKRGLLDIMEVQLASLCNTWVIMMIELVITEP